MDTTPSTKIDDGEGPSFVQKSPIQVQNEENVVPLQLGRAAHTITPLSVGCLQEECEGLVDVVLEQAQPHHDLYMNDVVVQEAVPNVALSLIQAEANEHIEPIADIVMNESCENVIVTSPSFHIEVALQFGNRGIDNTQKLIVPNEKYLGV